MRKMYYGIREASKLTDLPAHVLRYWESEFKELKPKKNRAGNRIYREADIELILELKTLLHDQRYTIEGARQELKTRREAGSLGTEGKKDRLLREIRQTCQEVLRLLDE